MVAQLNYVENGPWGDIHNVECLNRKHQFSAILATHLKVKFPTEEEWNSQVNSVLIYQNVGALPTIKLSINKHATVNSLTNSNFDQYMVFPVSTVRKRAIIGIVAQNRGMRTWLNGTIIRKLENRVLRTVYLPSKMLNYCHLGSHMDWFRQFI